MDKNLKNLIAPIALLSLLALPSLAHADKDKHDKGDNGNNSSKTVNERQERQQDRVHDGERSGQLTRHESSALRDREAQIRAEEKRDRRSGGDFTKSEKRRVQNQLDDLGREIGRQKHDDQNKDRHRDNDYYGDDYFYGSGGHRYSGTYYSPGYYPGGYYPGGYYPGGYYPDGYYPGSDYPYTPDRRHPDGRYPGGYYPPKDWPGTYNDRQEIWRGEHPRALTISEAALLRDREARIRVLEARLRDGNRLTPAERAGIQRELAELRRDVERQRASAPAIRYNKGK